MLHDTGERGDGLRCPDILPYEEGGDEIVHGELALSDKATEGGGSAQPAEPALGIAHIIKARPKTRGQRKAVAELTDQIADYELVGVRGRGASGVIHLALPPKRLHIDADLVVIKVLTGRHSRDRFLRIAEKLRLFTMADPAHLVSLYETGREQGAIWVSMAHHPRGSLLAPAASLSRAQLLRAVACAARGAHALHEVGVVHGAIKPSNVLLTADGAKLADLGLRSVLHPNMTLTAASAVTDVELLDPVVIRGEEPSRATDIWSLGVTLYRALTGEALFAQAAEDDVLRMIRRISSTRPKVDNGLTSEEAALVRSCLSPDPTERPPTADVMAKTIEDLL